MTLTINPGITVNPGITLSVPVRRNGLTSATASTSAWLDLHPEITHWVAVDDLYMGTWLDNFAWAKRVDLGIKDLAVQEQILGALCQ